MTLHGNYFVDTGHIWARVTIEDGTVFYTRVAYNGPTSLTLRMPPHQVPMLWMGLEATVEISHDYDRSGSNPWQVDQRYWQIISSKTNDVDKALRLQYYGMQFTDVLSSLILCGARSNDISKEGTSVLAVEGEGCEFIE